MPISLHPHIPLVPDIPISSWTFTITVKLLLISNINQSTKYLLKRVIRWKELVFVRSRPNSCTTVCFFPLSLLESIDCREKYCSKSKKVKSNGFARKVLRVMLKLKQILFLVWTFVSINLIETIFSRFTIVISAKMNRNLVSASSPLSLVLFFFSPGS